MSCAEGWGKRAPRPRGSSSPQKPYVGSRGGRHVCAAVTTFLGFPCLFWGARLCWSEGRCVCAELVGSGRWEGLSGPQWGLPEKGLWVGGAPHGDALDRRGLPQF